MDRKPPENCLTVKELPVFTTRISGVKLLLQQERRCGRSGHLGGIGSGRNLFDQYLFTEDKEYLKEIMPILEENVRFCLAQLQETDQGLAICPATSPENLFYEDCSVAEYSENTMAIARNLFRDYVKGCEVLACRIR